MKIVHICLACFYVEGMGYQENILPQYHAMMGHEVSVLTSNYAFNSKYEQTQKNQTDYFNDFGVHVQVLEKSKRYGYYSRFGDFNGLRKILIEISISDHTGEHVTEQKYMV
jgi:hypothetical protein